MVEPEHGLFFLALSLPVIHPCQDLSHEDFPCTPLYFLKLKDHGQHPGKFIHAGQAWNYIIRQGYQPVGGQNC